ncbi:MAG: TonB-dependent receptor plug domain-containing protein, partial [Saprospiraceae bacterium]
MLFGQLDTVAIPQINVVEKSIRNQSAGSVQQNWKAAEESKEVNDLGSLLDQNGIYIKSYGSNSLATSSIRGGSAGHTLVMWNGLPIQSPMLGLLNLTLLPLNSVEEINLQKGGGSALWGSGAIGGVVDLKNKADFQNPFSFSSNTVVGSFGRFNEQLKATVGNDRFQFVTKVLQEQSENDFTYEVAPGIPDRKQTNAAFRQLNVLHDFYYRTNNGHRFSAHFWKQESTKELPPTITQNRSGAHQDDRATRFILNWQKIGKSIVINSKAAWFNEHLDYFNNLSGLVSLSHFNTFLGESTLQYAWRNRHVFLAGTSHSFTRVHADGYKSSPDENKTALFISHKYETTKLQVHSTLRQEIVDGRRLPITPSVGIDYDPVPFISLKAKVSRNYRLPTFNDRYWAPGGNADLLAESGWSQEATLALNHSYSAFNFSFSSTVFNRNIEN